METSEILKKVRKIEIKARGLSSNVFAGQYHSAFKGRGMAFSEVREYQYGDDVRDIDWNVTARFHRPYGMFSRLVEIPGRKGTYMLAEELILHFLPEVFSGYNITCKSLVRVTRNADIDADKVYDEELNYRDHMAEVIKLRRKLEPVRLEYTRDIDKKIIKSVASFFKIDKEMIFNTTAPLDMSFLFDFQDDLRHEKELFYEKRIPQKSLAWMSQSLLSRRLSRRINFCLTHMKISGLS